MIRPNEQREGVEVTCRHIRSLIVPVWLNDPGVTEEERADFDRHLDTCARCAAEYADTHWLMLLLKRYWQVGDKGALPEVLAEKSCPEQERVSDRRGRTFLTVKESRQDLKMRSAGRAVGYQRQVRRRVFPWRIVRFAAAACALAAIGLGLTALYSGHAGRPASDSTVNADRLLAAGYAEVVTSEGRKPLALDQPMMTGDRPQEILLGGMHRVVMNRRTTAAFTAVPLARREDAGSGEKAVSYKVQLSNGELYVEVIPGHPFAVATPNARLDIAGTKFDVMAGGDQTELLLLKGSVRFSRAAGGTGSDAANSYVDVTAGYASTITGRSSPTVPRKIDPIAATAWARDLALANAFACVKADADVRLLNSIRDYLPQFSPPNLDSIDYQQWRDDHRDWFAGQFPWVFAMRKALKERHDIDADYVDLLIVSGDIWQFNYPRFGEQPIPIFNSASVRQIARHYGVEPDDLLEAAAHCATGGMADSPLAEAARRYQSAMRLWRSDVSDMGEKVEMLSPDLLMFTLRVGAYLANTRTAAWAWSRACPDKAASLFETWRRLGVATDGVNDPRTCRQWLENLKQDAEAAGKVSRLAEELIVAPRAAGCDRQSDALNIQLVKTIAGLASEGSQ